MPISEAPVLNSVDRLSTSPTSVRSDATGRLVQKRWGFIVGLATIVWFVALFGIARSLYLDFRLQRYDLGNMVQAVWSTANGRLLETTLGTGQQGSRLAAHVDPILALLTPLWLIVPSPLTLVAAQIAACALGAVPVFLLAKRHLSDAPAGLLAMAYLANPWLSWAALDAIHAATLTIPLVLFAVWFLDSDRLGWFVIMAVLAAMGGELIGLAIAGIGVWYWIAHGHRRAGLTIATLGVAWTIICLEVIIPHYLGAKSQYYGLYSAVGGSPGGVLRTAVTDPGAVAEQLLTPANLVYLLALAAPLAGAFLAAPLILVAAAPQLAANMLSSIGAHGDPRLHTVSVVLPFMMVATIFGIARLSPRRWMLASTVVLAMSAGIWVGLGPRAQHPRAWLYGDPPRRHVEAVREAIDLVPTGSSVAATTKAGSHLSARQYFYSVPTINRAEWVVIDTLDPWVPLRPPDASQRTWGSYNPHLLRAIIARLAASTDWNLVFEKSGVFVFQRAGA